MFLRDENRQFFRTDLDAAQVEMELHRFRSAVSRSIDQLRELTAHDDNGQNQSVSNIFGVHLLILESSFAEKIEATIRDQKVNVEWAVSSVSDEYLEKQASVPDENFKDKNLDIEDVTNRLLTAINGWAETVDTGSNAIIVARELRPSAIMEIAKSSPAALITTRGGWTSHTSILAREFRLPMVSGIRDLEQILSHNDQVIVDGFSGEIIIDPASQTIDHFRSINAAQMSPDYQHGEIEKWVSTLDGTEIVIRANADTPEAYGIAKQFGADGIGLFRSESLITHPGNIPSEDEQMSAYRQMADATGDSGVKIRTFDIGVDQIGDNSFSAERNPSLGLRSIRLSLSDSTHFRAQIRAILRAALGQKIDIVLPMISGVGEVLRARAIIEEERAELTNRSIPTGDPLLGAMIEVPSAVLTASEIAKKVDFLCLGTNDLVQYLLAVDRDNDSVADWYQTLHPAVIRAISSVLSAAKNACVPVAVCGEMAGSPFYVPLLIGLGARELSMNVNSIPQIRRLISGITLKNSVGLVEMAKSCETAEETEQLLRKYYLDNWSGLFPAGLLNSKHR